MFKFNVEIHYTVGVILINEYLHTNYSVLQWQYNRITRQEQWSNSHSAVKSSILSHKLPYIIYLRDVKMLKVFKTEMFLHLCSCWETYCPRKDGCVLTATTTKPL